MTKKKGDEATNFHHKYLIIFLVICALTQQNYNERNSQKSGVV